MGDIGNLKKQVESADGEQLRELILEWIERDNDFAQYVDSKLNPSLEQINYDADLSRAIYREAYAVSSRHRNTTILDWSNIYYYKVKPWTDHAETLTTQQLMKLVAAITMRIAMAITDEDFYGDDWNGDDYSCQISAIMEALGNIAGILLIREDLTEDYLEALKELIADAEENDVTYNYVGNPYRLIKELISLREEAGEVTFGMFDAMIEANLDRKGGEWMCRKIDFVENMGLTDEAWQLAEDNIKYPQVAIKLYLTLVNGKNWEAALKLLDRVIGMVNNKEYNEYSYGNHIDWMELKQKMLREHGTKEEQIKNLRQLFLNNHSDNEKYYDELKGLVDPSEWKQFYRNLFEDKSDYEILNYMANFLAEEHEFEWLFRLLYEHWHNNTMDYIILLKIAPMLPIEYESAIMEMLSRSFMAYAESRFKSNKRVKGSTYEYFCQDLKKLVDIGFSGVLYHLIQNFRDEYNTRPAFMAALRQINIGS